MFPSQAGARQRGPVPGRFTLPLQRPISTTAPAAAQATTRVGKERQQYQDLLSSAPAPATEAPSLAAVTAVWSAAGEEKGEEVEAPPQLKPRTVGGKWTKEEDELLRDAVSQLGPTNWKSIAEDYMKHQRSDVQCLHRWQKVLQPGLVKGPWTKEEDEVIVSCMKRGITKWAEIAQRVPGRLGKQCRERWFNHLNPDVKKGTWTKEEDEIMVKAQAEWGNAWTKIASLLPGRSENTVKNRWNSATRRSRTKGGKKSVAGMLWEEHQQATAEEERPKPCLLDPASGWSLQPAKEGEGEGERRRKVAPAPRRGSKKGSKAAAQAQQQEQEEEEKGEGGGKEGADKPSPDPYDHLEGPSWEDLAGLENFHNPFEQQPSPPQPKAQEQEHPVAPLEGPLPSSSSSMPPPPARQHHQAAADYMPQQYLTPAQAQQQYQALSSSSSYSPVHPHSSFQAHREQLQALVQAAAASSMGYSTTFPQHQQQHSYATHHAEHSHNSGYMAPPPPPQVHYTQHQHQQQQHHHHQAYSQRQAPLRPTPAQQATYNYPHPSSSFSSYDMPPPQQQQRPTSSSRRFSPSFFLEAGPSPSFGPSFPTQHPTHLPQQQQQQPFPTTYPVPARPASSFHTYQRGLSPRAVPPATSHPQLIYASGEDHFLRSPVGHPHKETTAGNGSIASLLTEGYQPEELHAVDHFLA